MKIHQNEICEGMIQYLERRAGLKRHDVRDRDQGNHMAAAEARVEKTFLLGEQLSSTPALSPSKTLSSSKTQPTTWSSPLELRLRKSCPRYSTVA